MKQFYITFKSSSKNFGYFKQIEAEDIERAVEKARALFGSEYLWVSPIEEMSVEVNLLIGKGEIDANN